MCTSAWHEYQLALNDSNIACIGKLMQLLIRHVTCTPAVCAQNEKPLWFTSTHPNTPLHDDLPLNTAVAIPLTLDALHKDMVTVFFSMDDVHRQVSTHAFTVVLFYYVYM
jgi:hypothetical protein